MKLEVRAAELGLPVGEGTWDSSRCGFLMTSIVGFTYIYNVNLISFSWKYDGNDNRVGISMNFFYGSKGVRSHGDTQSTPKKLFICVVNPGNLKP